MQLSAAQSSTVQRTSTSSPRSRSLLQPVRCHMARQAAFTSSQTAGAFTPSSSLSIVARRQMSQAAGARSVSRGVRAMAVKAEISYVMVKPDGVQRGLVGDIISRFERKGFKLVGLKLYQTPKEVAEEHYKDLKDKPFYGKLVEYIISGPVVAMVWEGAGVVASARKLIGATNPLASEPGTIRGDFAIEVGRNIVHGSDSPENGERETALWFGKDGVIAWDQHMTPWLKE